MMHVVGGGAWGCHQPADVRAYLSRKEEGTANGPIGGGRWRGGAVGDEDRRRRAGRSEEEKGRALRGVWASAARATGAAGSVFLVYDGEAFLFDNYTRKQ